MTNPNPIYDKNTLSLPHRQQTNAVLTANVCFQSLSVTNYSSTRGQQSRLIERKTFCWREYSLFSVSPKSRKFNCFHYKARKCVWDK